MKKILATILALVMALGLTATVWAADVSGSTSTKAAKIGDTEYGTLQAAIDAASDGENTVVVLLNDLTESITVAKEKSITLDLSGYTLTNEAGKHTITNYGDLTITSTGVVDNVSHACAALVNKEGATAELNGGSFTRSKENGQSKEDSGGNSYYNIQNFGMMTINDGVLVKQDGGFSSMIRNGGTSASTSTMIINGGTFNGGLNAIKNDVAGVLTINDGNFSNTSQYVIMNWHQATINNGTFQANGTAEAVLFTSKYEGATADGKLTVNNGTFIRTSDAQKMIRDYYDEDNKGTAAISGGAFKDATGKAVDVSAYLVAGKQQNSDGSVGNKSYYYYPSTSDTTTSTTTKGSPKTFDAGMGIYAVTAVLSVTGMAWTAKKRH